MIFEEAVTLARAILTAGYSVEVLSCREDGRLGPWRVYFRGPSYSSAVHAVSSPAEWVEWQRRIQNSTEDTHAQQKER